MRWPRPRWLLSPRRRRHRQAMGQLGRKEAEISGLIETGDAQVLSLLGSVDRFSAEIAAVITGREGDK
jgi:hypothetical protein